jgi:peptidoglycan/LPS O-acetylase OafA/YrhL
MNAPPPQRLAAVDAVKAIASQLIVLHHLAFYGPMSDRAAALAPALFGWLSDHARLAVQAFLVTGGFLAARALAPQGRWTGRPVAPVIARRYLRLAVPVVAAVVVALLAAWVARAWMDHPSIPGPATLAQIAANMLLIHDVLGYEALSAGLWYVAIDFQLFVVTLLLLRGAREHAFAAIAVLAVVSLAFFNRQPQWDIWAPYFFGAYALGAFAWWLAQRACPPFWAGVVAAAALAVLVFDFRIRIAVALATAALLYAVTRADLPLRWAETRVIAFLARISYSVFLVHFPVCLAVNAFWTRFMPADPWTSLLGVGVAWAASIAAGALAYRLVESRIDALAARRLAAPAPVTRERAAAD